MADGKTIKVGGEERKCVKRNGGGRQRESRFWGMGCFCCSCRYCRCKVKLYGTKEARQDGQRSKGNRKRMGGQWEGTEGIKMQSVISEGGGWWCALGGSPSRCALIGVQERGGRPSAAVHANFGSQLQFVICYGNCFFWKLETGNIYILPQRTISITSSQTTLPSPPPALA